MKTYSGNMVGLDFGGKRKTVEIPEAEPKTKTGTKSRYAKYAEPPIRETTREFSANTIPSKIPVRPVTSNRGVTPLKMFLAFVVLAVLMIVWVWEAAKVREEMAALERLKNQRLELEKANEAIRVDITKLTGFERISKIAKEQLDLKPATEKPGVILIDPDKAAAIRQTKP